jgi:Aerobic-type carbon monoxide dehydrogenase, large subunit CoxL/CutL homologs
LLPFIDDTSLESTPVPAAHVHEEFKCSICRSPVKFHIKTGAKKDGTLVAQSVTVYWDAGAYVTTTPRVNYNAGFAANGPYKLPNARVDGFAVMTNRTLGTAYRGFGVTEVATAHEHNMDKLAVMLDMDPLELRLKNILCEGDETISGQHINTIAVKECLEAAADNIGWKDLPLRWEKDGKLYGKGIACFNKLTGTPSTTSVLLRLNENGSLTILSASREMGQGVTTVLPQIASQALALDWEKIDVSPVDTQFTPYDKTTTSSRSTFHGGNAVLDAAEKLKKQLITLASIYFDLPESDIIYDDDGNIRSLSHPDKCVNINEIGKTSMMKEQPPVVATGTYGTSDIFDAPDEPTRQSTRPTVMWMHGAQAAIVEIDKGTGRSTLVKMGAGHDVGKAVNPLGCMQQIEGSIIMGWGHTVMEEMIYENGILKNGNMVDYKVPTFMDDTVEMNISLIEHAHPEGPYGVKGIGEPGLAPTAAAIANAICNACGREFTSIPIKPEQILLGEE